MAGTAALLWASAADAIPAKQSPNGQADFGYGTAGAVGNTPTSEKPESKLFYTPDGRWWAALGVGGVGLELHELVGHAWQPRVLLPGSRSGYRADTLFDARTGTLYVAARDDSVPAGTRQGNFLYRLRYRGLGLWSRPSRRMRITPTVTETLTIARDSARRLWTTWQQGPRVRVMATRPGRFAFRDVRSLGRGLDEDDISAVTAFGSRRRGRKIGVMWSNQTTGQFRFAWRFDRGRRPRWHVQTAYGGGVGCNRSCADDHLDLKAVGDSVYAVVKTSRNDVPNANPADPLIVLLRRDPRGHWSSFPVSPVAQEATRPVLLLSPARDAIWVFAGQNTNVVAWESPFARPGFNSAALTPWTSGPGFFTDPTTTRQTIPSGLPAVVETSKPRQGEYWHNEFLP